MGVWGTGLYSNDTSEDVRDLCNEIYPLAGVEKGTQLILDEYAETANGEADDDSANFWYALADWQWKHGILTEEINNKAISLLEAHMGIEEWEESGTAADVEKRLAVMDKLLQQLKSPQPEIRIPKAKIAKPKHKPGDIIVIRTCTKNHKYAETLWNIEQCSDPDLYAPEIAEKVPAVLCPPYEAYDKYLAVLCVGTEKRQHSQYVDGIFDEHSVYAFYDYLGDEQPTVGHLQQCGFLPKYLRYTTLEGNKIETVGWTYSFLLFSCRFRPHGKDAEQQIIEKISRMEEAERFHALFDQKSYLTESAFQFDLFDAFGDFFEEKARLSAAALPYDNLLSPHSVNPPLRSPEELDRLIHEEIKKEMQRSEESE